MTNYDIKENNEGVLKTIITQEVDIDLSQTVKNIHNTRAEFTKAWTSVYELVQAMESYAENHRIQNEFLEKVFEFTGEDLRLPELPRPYNSKEIIDAVKEFMDSESERRKENLENFKSEWEAEK